MARKHIRFSISRVRRAMGQRLRLHVVRTIDTSMSVVVVWCCAMGIRIQAALYHRVSTVDQHPDLARRELRTAARRYKMQVALEVEETGSGANNDRPGFVRVMDAARRGRIGAILVWKLDRFGRSGLDLLTHLRELESLGIRFVAITQGIDIRPGGDATSRLLLTMLTAVSEFERHNFRLNKKRVDCR